MNSFHFGDQLNLVSKRRQAHFALPQMLAESLCDLPANKLEWSFASLSAGRVRSSDPPDDIATKPFDPFSGGDEARGRHVARRGDRYAAVKGMGRD